MRCISGAILLLLSFFASFAQNSAEAGRLVEEGIQQNDEGKYPEAIMSYRDALVADTFRK